MKEAWEESGISDVMVFVRSGATTILHLEDAKATSSHEEPKNGTSSEEPKNREMGPGDVVISGTQLWLDELPFPFQLHEPVNSFYLGLSM